MKQAKPTRPAPRKLALSHETVRTLRNSDLVDVQGGQLHTSFSCGADLCTTH